MITQGYYSMTFHSELQIVWLIFEGGGSQRHSDVTLGKIVCRCSLRRALC